MAVWSVHARSVAEKPSFVKTVTSAPAVSNSASSASVSGPQGAAGANGADLAVDVTPAFEVVAAESWCHQCQIREWLPWIGRHQMPVAENLTAWQEVLRRRFARQARELNLPANDMHEVFTVTAWGEIPSAEQLEQNFPNLLRTPEGDARLRTKLKRWSA